GDPLQFVVQILGALPTLSWWFRETLLDDTFERGRRRRLARRNRRGGGRHDCGDQARLTLAAERLLARQPLVDDPPKRKDVRSCVRLLSFELLRGHVLKRAKKRPLRRQALWQRRQRWQTAAGPNRHCRLG